MFRRLARRKLLAFVVIVVAASTLANTAADRLGLKYLHPENRLWYRNAYAQQQSQQPVDVVFLGTSRFRFGINATRGPPAYRARQGADVRDQRRARTGNSRPCRL